MGFDARAPTTMEVEEMKSHVAEGMREGAFGISTGLGYAPGFFYTTEEIVELCQVVARMGGFYATHIRSTGVTFVEAVMEALEIGERAGIPVQLSHIESHYPNWGQNVQVLDLIDDAREKGIDVTCDTPPYLYGMTTLTSILPDWVQEGGFTMMLERLRDAKMRERIKEELPLQRDKYLNSSSIILAIDGYWDKIRIVKSDKRPAFNGKSIQAISTQVGKEPYDAVFDLLIEEEKMIMITGEFHSEEDLRTVLKYPNTMVESDERVYAAGDLIAGFPHPRAYGVFPMVYRKYVRGETRLDLPEERGETILEMEDAVRRMTALPANRLGLSDRGLLLQNMRADIVIFNPDTVEDKATYDNPHQYPTGISHVIVNGEIVVENGEHTGALPGKVLRGPSYRKQVGN
jgi:N-acyl-D-amino-acid deacylase